ncbi:hypothetical protein COCSUDRAFT_46844 [Coccomyxa subellipsoidea C-169]|uniref:Uncharacterized protein n=1 Tax=Coccomyxa subellipsoidea (strain C-169) TaxID=574566 RepID=I0Z1M2_COCSC|nr:hypothetical protein COCSUDRAFT_46844 [Coccomyxa subellipsoidea C-169]EIE24541.1 hypothetical protein COCSUDRAFT_46844 [Coccomyxa subellipsoidea C-169]|eukprot:XP_005649085.1 hypothetical protein COCSUDRAFT_46844 [Coccomyxa subellipsoidea C-169]
MVGSLRPRKSVDYSKAPAPGTPTWLKLTREDGEEDAANTAGTEKENTKPASAERKTKKAEVKAADVHPAKEQKQGKGRPPLARKDEAEDVTTEAAAAKKANADAVDHQAAVAEGPSTSGDNVKGNKKGGGQSAKDVKGDAAEQKSKARKSAPAPPIAEERPVQKDSKRKSAPEQLSNKRAVPEPSKDAKPAGKAAKKAKTSAAAEAPELAQQPRTSGVAEPQPARSSDSWKTSSRASKGKEAQEQAVSQPAAEDSKAQPAKELAPDKPRHAEKKADKPASARPVSRQQQPPALPPPHAPDTATESNNFKKLQVEYAALQSKYEAIKKQRIQQLETMLGEQSSKACTPYPTAMEHRESALKLAEHWKMEAERQAAFAQEAGSAKVREAQERLAQENSTLRAQLMETEAALLAEQEAVADLKHALAAADRRHATPLKADQAVQVSPNWLRMQAHDGAQEARAFCPEGANVSDLYSHPAHPHGSPATAMSCPTPVSGKVQCCPSAKPLVPYSIGCSVMQPRSRFAADADAAAPQLDAVQEEPQAAETVLEAPGTAPHAQAASAPAILNRTAWPEIAKDANLSSPSGTLCLTCRATKEIVPGSEAQSAVGQGAVALPPPQVGGSQLSNMTQKALNTLVGLEAAPAEGGGFTYTHHESGFVFEIAPIDEESEDAIMDGVQELAFNPIKMGFASKVLPGYLHEEIIFAAMQKQKLVGRIMEALGTFTLREARDGKPAQPA